MGQLAGGRVARPRRCAVRTLRVPEEAMKTVKSVLLLAFAALAVAYLVARPWTPLWVDTSVIVLAIGIALANWIKNQAGK